MLTLFGSLIGFIISFFPELMQMRRERLDREHEIKLLQHQIEYTKLLQSKQIQEVPTDSSAFSSASYFSPPPVESKFVRALRGSVRPVITYIFFFAFVVFKGATLIYLVYDQRVLTTVAINEIWDPETQALFAGIISFWFGNTAMNKMRNIG